jgi:hypothetical protein
MRSFGVFCGRIWICSNRLRQLEVLQRGASPTERMMQCLAASWLFHPKATAAETSTQITSKWRWFAACNDELCDRLSSGTASFALGSPLRSGSATTSDPPASNAADGPPGAHPEQLSGVECEIAMKRRPVANDEPTNWWIWLASRSEKPLAWCGNCWWKHIGICEVCMLHVLFFCVLKATTVGQLNHLDSQIDHEKPAANPYYFPGFPRDLTVTGVGDALLPAPAWFTPAVAGGPVGKLNCKPTSECMNGIEQ